MPQSWQCWKHGETQTIPNCLEVALEHPLPGSQLANAGAHGGQLLAVSLPDGRSLNFTVPKAGKGARRPGSYTELT